jgi:anti-sigma regulatory factor (Ser/Thr protein kinase)
VVGEVEFGSTPREHAAWTRYESVLNAVFAGRSAWIVCPYDRRRLPASVVELATHTHSHELHAGERQLSATYELPDRFVQPLALEPGGPLVGRLDLTASLRPLRTFVRDATAVAGMARGRSEEVVLAVSEVATNATTHGRPPVEVRCWHEGPALLFEVRDHGPGIADPLAGFRPPPLAAAGGAGLWIARQLGDEVEVLAAEPGTRVQLRFLP